MSIIGRNQELHLLKELVENRTESSMAVVYGRRRVGKTFLVENAFRNSKAMTFLKFEGVENGSATIQKRYFLDRLTELTNKDEFRYISGEICWKDLLLLFCNTLAKIASLKKPVVILFDEFQWLCCERTALVSDLKYVWDNYLCKLHRIHLILCGSVSSFMVKKVLNSKALYGRILMEINLRPLKFEELKASLLKGRHLTEQMDAFMILGGIPLYLKLLKKEKSLRLNIEELFLNESGFFYNEFERIFISHFGKTAIYKKIVNFLSLHPYANKDLLAKALGLRDGGGGRFSAYLEDLQLAGLIESYVPIGKEDGERLRRYKLMDEYCRFYLKFIQPNLKKIKSKSRLRFEQLIEPQQYAIWKGLGFEFFCYKHQHLISKYLGFESVNYEFGPWYNRNDLKENAQVDLLFLRKDRVITLCELKYTSGKIGKEIIAGVEKKVQVLNKKFSKYTIEKVLISLGAVTKDLVSEDYFTRIVQAEEIF